MVRRLAWFSLGQVIRWIIRILILAAVMLLATVFAIIRGIWQQSHSVALGWAQQLRGFGVDGPETGPLFWLMRVLAITMMLLCWMALSWGLTWLLGRT